MFSKKINYFCGYAFFLFGNLRIIIVLMGLVLMGNTVINLSGGNTNVISYELFEIIATILGLFQILLGIISIIMIFLNKKDNPEVVSGYLYALGGFLLGFVSSVFTVFFEASLYMKAGSKIIKTTSRQIKTNAKEANAEWFYNRENKDFFSEKNDSIIWETKNEKRNEKILEEIYGWRDLMDSGEIDEETYNEMKNKLLKKMQK